VRRAIRCTRCSAANTTALCRWPLAATANPARSRAVRAHGGSGHIDFESETFVGEPVAFEGRFVRNGRGAPGSVVPPLKAQSGQTGKGDGAPLIAEPLSVNGYTYTHEGKVFRLRNAVGLPPRRLTPRECERLQGLPDDWTAIAYRGKPAADGSRYRAIGNSMAVPVIRWILRRLSL
jgi:site-specific DNA-cytosine methylase